CAVDLRLLAPDLPPFPVPAGHDEASWLVELVEIEGRERYGPRPTAERPEQVPGAWAQLDHELEVITDLHFPGYFLIVHEIVDFCAGVGVLAQGRGSAASRADDVAVG